MDDLASKITELLGDPEGMKRITDIASSLMSGEQSNALNAPKSESQPKDNEGFNLSDMQLDPVQMGNMMKLMSVLKSQNKEDDNTRLLNALKPHLSAERRKKVDKAISLLKIVKLLPILKESGLTNIF